MRTGPSHDVFGEGRQNLLNDAIMGMTKLGGPLSSTQADPLSVDEAQRARKILLVDVAGDMALVKVELDYPKVKFTDYYFFMFNFDV